MYRSYKRLPDSEFEKFGTREMTIKDELIQLRLIEGMCDASCKHKFLEQLQFTTISLDASIDFQQ